jgi:hypothetical protein
MILFEEFSWLGNYPGWGVLLVKEYKDCEFNKTQNLIWASAALVHFPKLRI